MVLSDREILMEIDTGKLVFDPQINPERISPTTIDLLLGEQLTLFAVEESVDERDPGEVTIDYIDLAKVVNVEKIIKGHSSTVTISENDGYILKPREFVLAYTLESIFLPDYLGGRIEGPSSFARLGAVDTPDCTHSPPYLARSFAIGDSQQWPVRLFADQGFTDLSACLGKTRESRN